MQDAQGVAFLPGKGPAVLLELRHARRIAGPAGILELEMAKKGPGFLPLFIMLMALAPLFARSSRRMGCGARGIVYVTGTDETLVGSALYALKEADFPHEEISIEQFNELGGVWGLPDGTKLGYGVCTAVEGGFHQWSTVVIPPENMGESLVDAMKLAQANP